MTITSNKIDSTPDAVLVHRALAGQRSAFDELVIRYRGRAVAVAYRLLNDFQDALEVSQEAFLKAFMNLPRLHRAEAFGAWLLRIVSNLSLNVRRGRRMLGELPMDDLMSDAGGAADPFRVVQSRELGARCADSLARLPDRQRTALLRFTLDELPQKQIAEQLDCSVEAVKWHVFDGRRRLRAMLGEDEP